MPRATLGRVSGAIVFAPASLFLTIHPSESQLAADLVHAGRDTLPAARRHGSTWI
jgi:hypothetical protein